MWRWPWCSTGCAGSHRGSTTCAGRWGQQGQMPLTTALYGRTAGIVGLGRIGKAVARRLAACGLSVLYHGRREQTDVPYRFVPDLLALARDSDVLLVCCPATADTVGLVGNAVLEALGPKGVLINVARGSIVDEAALIEALQTGRLGGAGLDVCRDEPHPDPALLVLNSVTLLPHIGAATTDTRIETFEVMARNLGCYFAGCNLPNTFRSP